MELYVVCAGRSSVFNGLAGFLGMTTTSLRKGKAFGWWIRDLKNAMPFILILPAF